MAQLVVQGIAITWCPSLSSENILYSTLKLQFEPNLLECSLDGRLQSFMFFFPLEYPPQKKKHKGAI